MRVFFGIIIREGLGYEGFTSEAFEVELIGFVPFRKISVYYLIEKGIKINHESGHQYGR